MTFLILSALLYFLPTFIGRHKTDAMGIFIVNLLFWLDSHRLVCSVSLGVCG